MDRPPSENDIVTCPCMLAGVGASKWKEPSIVRLPVQTTLTSSTVDDAEATVSLQVMPGSSGIP